MEGEEIWSWGEKSGFDKAAWEGIFMAEAVRSCPEMCQ